MDVLHDQQHHKFYIPLGADEAVLLYRPRGPVLDFHHVSVPPAFRGRGLADQLARAAFDYARREGFSVVPTCPFIAGAFLTRAPEYRDLTRHSPTPPDADPR